MIPYNPFFYKKEDKKEPLPLYLDIEEYFEAPEQEDLVEKPHVIIIDIF